MVDWYIAIPVMALVILFAWQQTKPAKYEFDLTTIDEPEDLQRELESLNSGIYEVKPRVVVNLAVFDELHYMLTRKEVAEIYPKLTIDYVWESSETKK